MASDEGAGLARQQSETFLDAPASLSLEDARVVILPAPYDGASALRKGARHAPSAIINASRGLEEWDAALGVDVTGLGVYTVPAVGISPDAPPEAMAACVREAAARCLAMGKTVGILGGDHSVTIGGVAAARERFPNVSTLYLDAHADLRDAYEGSRWSHACVASRLLEMTPVVEVGVRSMSREEAERIAADRLPVFTWPPSRSPARLAEEVVTLLGPEVYVSVDVDVFDPSLMPAVAYPEPGGMTWGEVTSLLGAVASRRRIVGFDVVELIPELGPAACASTAARLAQRLIGLALASG